MQLSATRSRLGIYDFLIGTVTVLLKMNLTMKVITTIGLHENENNYENHKNDRECEDFQGNEQMDNLAFVFQ